MNFSSMVSRVQLLVGDHALLTGSNDSKAQKIVNAAHEELMEYWEWSRKKQEIVIVTSADKTAGTVNLTNGSENVTGSSTAFAAADVGKTIVLAGALHDLYTIKTYTSPTAIVLGDLNGTTVGYHGENVTGAAYRIFQRFYSLTTGIESIMLPSRQYAITEVSMELIDATDPSREETGDIVHFARGPRTSAGLVQVEFWPRPNAATVIRVPVLKGHTDMSGTTEPIVPSIVVIWKAAEDACYYLQAKTNDENWLQLADGYKKSFIAALSEAKILDAKKFGLPSQIREGRVDRTSSEWMLDHDPGV
jgi:hypothetical protein